MSCGLRHIRQCQRIGVLLIVSAQVGTLKPPFYKMFIAKEKIQSSNVIVFVRTELRHETQAFCIIIVLRFIVISNIMSKINDSVNFDY